MVLANLVTATHAYITLVALLKKTIAELSSEVINLTSKLETMQSENARLKRSGIFLAPTNYGHRSANIGAPSDQNPLRDHNIYSKSGQKIDPTGIAHLTGSRSNNTILLRLAATWLTNTTHW